MVWEEKIIDLLPNHTAGWLAMPRTASLNAPGTGMYAYPYRFFRQKSDAIALFAAANPNSEVELVAGSIIRLVQERGWRWRDIAVLGNNMENIWPQIARVFNDTGYPVLS
jgi:ATP-dependent helicase/DNAse subunit B